MAEEIIIQDEKEFLGTIEYILKTIATAHNTNKTSEIGEINLPYVGDVSWGVALLNYGTTVGNALNDIIVGSEVNVPYYQSFFELVDKNAGKRNNWALLGSAAGKTTELFGMLITQSIRVATKIMKSNVKIGKRMALNKAPEGSSQKAIDTCAVYFTVATTTITVTGAAALRSQLAKLDLYKMLEDLIVETIKAEYKDLRDQVVHKTAIVGADAINRLFGSNNIFGSVPAKKFMYLLSSDLDKINDNKIKEYITFLQEYKVHKILSNMFVYYIIALHNNTENSGTKEFVEDESNGAIIISVLKKLPRDKVLLNYVLQIFDNEYKKGKGTSKLFSVLRKIIFGQISSHTEEKTTHQEVRTIGRSLLGEMWNILSKYIIDYMNIDYQEIKQSETDPDSVTIVIDEKAKFDVPKTLVDRTDTEKGVVRIVQDTIYEKYLENTNQNDKALWNQMNKFQMQGTDYSELVTNAQESLKSISTEQIEKAVKEANVIAEEQERTATEITAKAAEEHIGKEVLTKEQIQEYSDIKLKDHTQDFVENMSPSQKQEVIPEKKEIPVSTEAKEIPDQIKPETKTEETNNNTIENTTINKETNETVKNTVVEKQTNITKETTTVLDVQDIRNLEGAIMLDVKNDVVIGAKFRNVSKKGDYSAIKIDSNLEDYDSNKQYFIISSSVSDKTSAINNLDPNFYHNFNCMCYDYLKETKNKITFTSGYRSYEHQKKLWEKYQSGKGNRANRPGYSLHEYGLAVDIRSNDANKCDELGLLKKWGMYRPIIGKEPWHIQPISIKNTNGDGNVAEQFTVKHKEVEKKEIKSEKKIEEKQQTQEKKTAETKTVKSISEKKYKVTKVPSKVKKASTVFDPRTGTVTGTGVKDKNVTVISATTLKNKEIEKAEINKKDPISNTVLEKSDTPKETKLKIAPEETLKDVNEINNFIQEHSSEFNITKKQQTVNKVTEQSNVTNIVNNINNKTEQKIENKETIEQKQEVSKSENDTFVNNITINNSNVNEQQTPRDIIGIQPINSTKMAKEVSKR